MQKDKSISISINKELLERIDANRKLTSRSAYIENRLENSEYGAAEK